MRDKIHHIKWRHKGERQKWAATFIGDAAYREFVERTKDSVVIIKHEVRE